ncbi:MULTISPECIES: YCF48-related protein [Pseudomonas]|uniref:WD40/YVTN/BNR-like repeat-containing protein n=1 Tax=Pseudomonas TaxID=286 RepID=UPI0021186A9B|nr:MULTISPECIES: YCF48-related protein [Pseudomonas]
MANRILSSMQFRLRILMVATVVMQAAMQTMPVVAAEPLRVLKESSTISAKAQRSVLLSITHAGNRLVAVGERGIILLSDDAGQNWRQASSPVSVTLTAVQFVNADQGWAVGHLGIVLHSADGGETWTRQLDGIRAAELMMEQAKQSGNGQAIKNAEWLVADGPDKPFLDLAFIDQSTGFITGAYGLIFMTRDGGKTWLPWAQHLSNDSSLHLNGITANGKNIFIVGERGLLLRSLDGGETFATMESPYEGSFFGALSTGAGDVLIYGLRGNAYLSRNNGESWQKVSIKTDAAISSAAQRRDGSLLLASQAGEVFTNRGGGASFETLPWRGAGSVSDITETPAGELSAVGLHGLERAPLDQGAAAE